MSGSNCALYKARKSVGSHTSRCVQQLPVTVMRVPFLPSMTSAGPSRIVITDVVDPAYRDAVARVMSKPTLSARGTSEEILCTPAVYDWLVEHPDRVALAWRRMKVPCVEITEVAAGKFHWADEHGDLTWQTVGRFPEGRVWYATGKVKAAALMPSVPVKAVAILYTPRTAGPTAESATIQPLLYVYLQTDSRVATTVLRMIGPSAPRMAEQGAEQLLLFFSGPARYLFKHPEEMPTLLAPANGK